MPKSFEEHRFTISVAAAVIFLFTTLGLAYALGAKTMNNDDRVTAVEQEQTECKAARIKQGELNQTILRSLAVIETNVKHIKEAVDDLKDNENK